jgi:hypothetical protein
VWHLHRFEKFGQDGRWETGLSLIQIARQQIDWQNSGPLQFVQNCQQGIAILAVRQAHQPLGARFRAIDHAVLVYGFASEAYDSLSQLAEFRAAGRPVKERVNIVGIIQHELALV